MLNMSKGIKLLGTIIPNDYLVAIPFSEEKVLSSISFHSNDSINEENLRFVSGFLILIKKKSYFN